MKACFRITDWIKILTVYQKLYLRHLTTNFCNMNTCDTTTCSTTMTFCQSFGNSSNCSWYQLQFTELKQRKALEKTCFGYHIFSVKDDLPTMIYLCDQILKAIWVFGWTKFRSSRSQLFFKIGALKNFSIFTGKHLLWWAATWLKKHSNTGIFLWILWNF